MTVFAIVVLLRKEIALLLSIVRKVKAGPVEAEFERQVKELKSEVADSLPAPERAALKDEAKRLFQLAEISPRAAIVEAWQGIEFAARRAVIQRAGSPVPDVSSPAKAFKALSQLGLLTPEDAALFEHLRGLRNQAIHSPDFAPSYESTSGFLQIADSVRARFERLASSEMPSSNAENQ